MSGWGFNLSNLKTLGDKLQDGLSELERNLAQPVVQPTRSSSSSDLNRSTNSPSRTNSLSTSSPSRSSRPTPHPLVTADATPRGSVDSTRSLDNGSGVGSPNAERSASELATGAMSSLREQLRRKRLAAEAARNGGVTQGVVVKPRDEPPAPDTPTKQPLLVDYDPAGHVKAETSKAPVSLMDADEDEPTPPLTAVANEPSTSIVDHHSALPSTLQTPIQAGFINAAPEPPTESAPELPPVTLAKPSPPSPPLAASDPPPQPESATTLTDDSSPPAESHVPKPAVQVDDSATALPFDVEPDSSAAKDLLRPSSPDLFAISSTADATPLEAVTREGSPAPGTEELEADAQDDRTVVPDKEEPVAEEGSLEKPVEAEEEAREMDQPAVKGERVQATLPLVEADEQEEKVTVEDGEGAEEQGKEEEEEGNNEAPAPPSDDELKPEPISEVQVITSNNLDDEEAPAPPQQHAEEDIDDAKDGGIPAVDESAPTLEAVFEGRSIPDAVGQEAQLEQAKAEEEAEGVEKSTPVADEEAAEEPAPAPLPVEEVQAIADLVGEEEVAVKAEVDEVTGGDEPAVAPSEPELEPESAVEDNQAAVTEEPSPAVKVEELVPEVKVEEAVSEVIDGPESVTEAGLAVEQSASTSEAEPQTYAKAVVGETEAESAPVVKDEPTPAAPLVEVTAPAPITTNGTAIALPDSRLNDITAAYERLQALKTRLDRIVSEVTPLNSVDDIDAFEGELRNMKGKTEMSMSEIGKLTGDLTLQKERFAELRDAHRQESRSQTERIDDLSAQVTSKDSALALLASKLEKAEAANAASKAEITKLNDEAVKLRQTAKDEEEKRTKALSLLRALRQKLVKTEKDKEEAERARDELQARAKEAGDGNKAERVRFEQEIVSLRAAQQSEIAKLRASFEKDVQAQKAALERDANAKKAQFELDAITAKAQHNKDLQAKDARVAQLEKTVKELGAARDELFDQLQVRTAEAESAGAHQQSLQGQTGELQYELQEAKDKAAALLEEVEELRKARRDVARDEVNVRKLLAEAEARHEAKIRDLTARARGMEKERQEAADEASKQLAERLKEVERMRETIAQKDKEYAQSVQSAKVSEGKIAEAEKQRAGVEKEMKEAKGLLASVKEDQAEAVRVEAALREELGERAGRSAEIEHRLEEVVAKESELRSKNKILRDELRKLQSGVALRETARAPGVGYFAQHSAGPAAASTSASTPGAAAASGAMSPQSENGVTSPTLSQSTGRGRTGSIYGGSTLSLVPGGTGADLKQASEEAINFEYLRNLLLQFLEKPEMRPHLISVMSVVMRFTPAEQRRLVAKAGGR